MRILVTGGAGFIGSRLCNALVTRGHRVRVLDNLSPQIHGTEPGSSELRAYLSSEVEFRQGDVRDRGTWLSTLEGQDAVVHFAAETGTGQSMYEIERYVDVNVRGTALLLELLANRERSVRKVVVASSRAIYGEGKYQGPAGVVYPGARSEVDMKRGDFECKCPVTRAPLALLPTDEESRIHPSSIYGITKQNQEQMVLAVGESCGFSAVAFRYQNVYGPGQSLKNPYTGILSIFSTLLLQGHDINVFEDGKESRDFVFIDDVVNATVLGLENDAVTSEVLNVGSGVATDVITVAQALKRCYGALGELRVTGNFRLGDIRHNVADISRIGERLGYRPSVSFADGIERFAAWVRTQQIEDNGYARSLEEMRARGLMK